jgi:hypothetical protein
MCSLSLRLRSRAVSRTSHPSCVPTIELMLSPISSHPKVWFLFRPSAVPRALQIALSSLRGPGATTIHDVRRWVARFRPLHPTTDHRRRSTIPWDRGT